MRDPLFIFKIRNKAWGPREIYNNIIVEGNKERGNMIWQLEKNWGNENTKFPSVSIQITFQQRRGRQYTWGWEIKNNKPNLGILYNYVRGTI